MLAVLAAAAVLQGGMVHARNWKKKSEKFVAVDIASTFRVTPESGLFRPAPATLIRSINSSPRSTPQHRNED